MRKMILLVFIFVLFLPPSVIAQAVQPRKLVDCPTAGLLPRGSFDVDLRLFPEGGALGTISVGLTNRLLLGVSYGGEKIISEQKAAWFPHPGVNIKYRILEENFALPALALGFDSQGYGGYAESDSLSRYDIKSKGFYCVASKNYKVLGTPMGLHMGINYSLEDEDGDTDPSLYVGMDKGFSDEFAVVVEYDFAFNDNKELDTFGKGNGYLDVGLRWFFGDRLSIEFDFMNVVQNRKDIDYLARQVRIVYLEYF